ncbi:MAG: DNA-directed RNA polymerase subunit beta, partial [Synergistaceae bacterium]|nr:DNA-directed RNA polymerase subunit beta [Synergistaceae bacterium]
MPEFVPISKSRRRYTFGRAHDMVEMPDMIEVQRDSYKWFYQEDVNPDERKSQGLQELLQEVFPIESYDGQFALEFVRYSIDPPLFTEEDARQKDMTWSRRVRATIRLTNMKTQESKEEKIFLGDFPVMTERGTFIINGTERVVINQLARSAGIYFTNGSPANSFSAKLIPDRGAWLDFSMTPNEVAVSIDNRKKLPATLLLKAFGMADNGEILDAFNIKSEFMNFSEEMKDRLAGENIYGGADGKQLIIERGMPVTRDILLRLSEQNPSGGMEILEDTPLTQTLRKETTHSPSEAMLEIFRILRANEPAHADNARNYFHSMFMEPRRYTLGRVGRYKLNKRLGTHVSEDQHLLTLDDIVAIMKEMFAMHAEGRKSDDIDHLGNRRVRSIGELLQNQVRIGLLRMERIVRERMTTTPNLNAASGRDLVNARPITAALREFFGSGQLSQFMDQTNPLSEVTHRRRLSALGPGGLTRDRAGFEARDVHYTHYGRVCPIETPEGPNIGLVSSLTTYARLNEYGFLITPRRRVIDGKLTDKIEFLSADEEDKYHVAMANTPIKSDGVSLAGEYCPTRHGDDIDTIPVEQVNYMDVSPKQIVSSSTALIPFLEHDDANRALMGSNMQRQAVPLILPEAPVVGTGIEHRIAKDSGACVIAKEDGEVSYVDSERIKIKYIKDEDKKAREHEYKLIKFRRS